MRSYTSIVHEVVRACRQAGLSLTRSKPLPCTKPTVTKSWRRELRHRQRMQLSALVADMQQLVSADLPLTTQQSAFLGAFLVDYAIQLVGWAIACILRTDRTYDMFGSATFFTLSIGTLLFGGISVWRQVVVSACVCLWSARLGLFLVQRVFKIGHDSRLQPYVDKPASFLVLWLIQGVWVFVTLLPLLLLNSSPSPAALQITDVVGLGLWTTGFFMESIADQQKMRFKVDPANKGRFINTGLWRYARYPNYGGEMLVWWGIFLACTPAFATPWAYLSAASPLFVMLLLLKVSGIPLQERQAQQRWGAEAAYQEYRRSTRLLFPVPKW